MRVWLRIVAVLLTGSILFIGGSCVIAAVSDSDKFDALKRFSQVLDIVERYYVKEVPRKELVDGALKGMLQSLDPHSTLLTQEEFKEMQEATSGEFCGIGIEITLENNQLTVVAPIDDTPADKAGIKAGDYILAVNGRPTSEMSLQEAASLIRGPKKTEVELTILHKNSKEPLTVKIKRDTIPLISVKSRELEPGYYWIRISRFSERTTAELLEALKNASKKEPIKGIVLDLRSNPGGLFEQAISITDIFLKEGTIVSIKGRMEENSKEFKASSGNNDITAPIVVLVNAGSASASEIVAGALGDQKRALIIGERTFGKGSVQNIIPLSDETGLKLTVALYYTPSGRSIQAEGITPDIEIPFDPTPLPQTQNPFHMLREKDLRKHLEKNNPNNDTKSKKNDIQIEQSNKNEILPDVKEFLDKDNQLRLGLQFVKMFPKFRELQ